MILIKIIQYFNNYFKEWIFKIKLLYKKRNNNKKHKETH